MRALLCLLFLSGCLDDKLDADLGLPFACANGACPDGYSCQQQLCIPKGGMAPPIPVATTSAEASAPLALWDGSHFSVVWQTLGGDLDSEGIYLAQVAGSTIGTPNEITVDHSATGFNAVYEPKSGLFVVAAARNAETDNILEVFTTRGAGDTPGRIYYQHSAYTAFGYSQPAVAARTSESNHDMGAVTVAYAYGDPPTTVDNNLVTKRFDLPAPGTDMGVGVEDMGGPSATAMGGRFVSNVILGEFNDFTVYVWRSEGTADATLASATVGITEADPCPPTDMTACESKPLFLKTVLEPAKLVVVDPAQHLLAMVWQNIVTADGSANIEWKLGLWNNFVPGTVTSVDSTISIDSSRVAPDVAGYNRTFVVCVGDDDGGASIVTYVAQSDGVTIAQQGSPRPLPRYSTAAISSCKVAVAPPTTGFAGAIGIAWSELIPPTGARIYFQTMPLEGAASP